MSVFKTSIALACAAVLCGVSVAKDNQPAPAPESLKAQPFNIQGIEGFNASIGLKDNEVKTLSKKEQRQAADANYQEKSNQHFMSVHADKGVSCISCHDQRANTGVAWMAYITKPQIKQDCKQCHETQAKVVSHADTHSDLECVACHMPNMPLPDQYSADQGKAAQTALRRSHMYKINTKEDAHSYVETVVERDGKKVTTYTLAKDENGNSFVDLMWSCARNAPADTAVFEGKGCHSPYTSKLEEGLVFGDQKQLYGELLKWQSPIKDGYRDITGAITRIQKLLEVTKLDRDQKTEVLSLLDQADLIAQAVKKDGSWGAHAQRYLEDRIQAGLHYVNKAQDIVDGKLVKSGK